MPRHTTLTIAAGQWTQLTDADVSAITFQNRSGYSILIKATTTASAPTGTGGAIQYGPGQGERNAAMSDLFPGLTGADRVWAWCDLAAQVMVSHA